jgi:DNA-binding NarL/FixJ family response regulator
MSKPQVVTVRGLRKSYGTRVVVDGLDLDVPAGEGVPAEDLQRAVRAVAEGAWLDPAVTARVLAIYRAAPLAAAQAGRNKNLDALTSRELEVLALIGRGKTNGEIAAELFVSEGTVKTHINHLFTKLRLRDRAAAVVFAFDHGLVQRPG